MEPHGHDDQKKTQYQKAFLVTEDTHSMVKEFCKQNNMKINIWVDNMLKDIVKNSNRNKVTNDH
jgi:hypothetical protein